MERVSWIAALATVVAQPSRQRIGLCVASRLAVCAHIYTYL